MERELIESLLIDDRLGNLSSDSSRLLAEYLAAGERHAGLAGEVDKTLVDLKQVLAAGPEEVSLPALRLSGRRFNAGPIGKLAAGLILAIGIFFAGYNAGDNTVKTAPSVPTANAIQVRPQTGPAKPTGLWPKEELLKRFDSAGSATTGTQVRELIKKYNLRGVIL